MDQYIGKMLDNRYEILERIGTGGMAVVYKARCHRLNRLVAIKILKPELASDEDFLRRFQVESQAVAMLSHTNIVSIYDVCRSDGLDYIVIELIDGMSLKQYMQKRGVPLNWREALHFITQIVRALGHAHSRGIVHRDIKPHNIMVLRDGSVKVTDFGIARLTSSAQATLTQETLGSVHYISPEQAKGSHVDGRSDLYSVGVMLYEMLTGRLPFEGETPVFVAIQHINSIPVSPRELNPDIPAGLEAITMKAMAPNADQRYLSAEDMLNDLREFRKNPGAVFPTPSTSRVNESEDEVDEPTQVVPVNSVRNAERIKKESPEVKKPEKDTFDVKSERSVQRQADNAEESERRPVKPRRRGVPPVLIAIAVILIFLGSIGYFLYEFFLEDLFLPDAEYTIPDLRGYTVEQIANDPSLLNGFSFQTGHIIYDPNYKEGQICRQNPAGNTIVKDPETVITVTISSGEDVMYLPEISTMEGRQAVQLLKDMGLKVVQEKESHEEIPQGMIIFCSLPDGAIVERGDTVTIVISTGPKEVFRTVLPFTGVSFDQVTSQMESLGLVIDNVEYFHSDIYPAGQVMWQSIPADTEVEIGTTIDFHVSLGPVFPEDPVPSEDIVIPSEGVDAPASVKTVDVDLSEYSGTVTVRIMVGSAMLFDGKVDCAATQILSRTTTGTGTQQVNIYINEELVNSYELQF